MTTQLSDLASLLDTASPVLLVSQIETVAHEVFGLAATVTELTGERDRNFHLLAGGKHYVLKVSNPAEDRRVIDFQTRALLHIAAVDPALPVPRVMSTRSGETEWLLRGTGEEPRVVRVLSFLQGEPLYRVATGPSLRRNLGRHVGAARPRAARILSSGGGSRTDVGLETRKPGARSAHPHQGQGGTCACGAVPRQLRNPRAARFAASARPGDPQ